MGRRRTFHFTRRVNRRAAIAGFALILLLIGWGAAGAGSALVVRADLRQPDAIISLASHEWERLPLAARLTFENPNALLLLTLPQPVTRFNCHDCAHRVERLRRLGVAEGRIRVIPLAGPGTHGEAIAALAFARQSGIRRLLVATSPYHTRRSLAVFRKVFAGTGIEVGTEPALDSSPARPARWWLAGYDRAYVAYEWAAIGYYTWKYGVGPAELKVTGPGT